MTNVLYDGVFAPHAASEKVFLFTPAGEISYAAFTQMTNRLANCLVKNGLQSGDRVAVQADKSVTQLALYAATIKAGGVYLPLNTGYTPHELDYFVGDAKPAIVVVADGISAAITPLEAGIGATLLTLNADETGSLTRQADTASADFVAIARGSEDL
ncbi:MAG: AMP-binding protein, partial [Candidatus Puniceispirillaceae bacterium]